MAVEIKMPRLSQTTDEVRFLRWLVHEGDMVKKGDPLCEVETDKVTMEVESFAGGRVLELIIRPDTVVDAGTLIAVLGGPKEKLDGETVKEHGQEPESQYEKTAETTARDGSGRIKYASTDLAHPSMRSTEVPTGVKTTPLVLNIARKRGIDLQLVKGSGPGGLVTKRDLELFEQREATHKPPVEPAGEPAVEPKGEAPVAASGKLQSGTAGPGEYKLSPSQAAVARNMSRSKSVIPHYYLKTTVFADHTMGLIEKSRQGTGGRLSIYSLFIHAAAGALHAYPELNGFFRGDPVRGDPVRGDPVRACRVVLMEDIHVGFAVESGKELFVPVVRNAGRKSVEEIDSEVKRLAAKAKSGKLEPQDIRGGTFTVTNLGIYPVDEFCAIINYPQLGILAMGTIGKTIFIGEDNVMKIIKVFTVTGSFDHRWVNGALGAKFLQIFKQIMEGAQGG